MISILRKDDIHALEISKDSIIDTFRSIITKYQTNQLELYGVKKVWTDELENSLDDVDRFFANVTAPTLQLIFLACHIECFVHKDLVAQFVQRYISDAGRDQQVRHLGSQKYWYILNRSAKVPNTNEIVPSGCHYLVTLDSPNPKAVRETLKRAGRVAARNFEGLKAAFGYRCATCNMEEGRIDPRTNQVVVLQQGHMNPSKSLTLDNTIPQCQYCNQTYKDIFVFKSNGAIDYVYNPNFILRSSIEIQKATYELLKEKFK